MTKNYAAWVGAAVLAAVGMTISAARAASDDPPIMTFQPNQSFTVNAYLGMVNGEPMFADGVLRPKDEELKRIAKLSRSLSEFKSAARDVVQQEINLQEGDILALKDAKAALTDDDNKRVDTYMNIITKEMLTKYEGSAAKAEQDLRAQGTTMAKVLEDKKRSFIVNFYMHKVLAPKIVVTRQQIMEEYQRKIKDFTHPADVDLYTISIPIDNYLKKPGPDNKQVVNDSPTDEEMHNATAAALNYARQLVYQIKAGADFAELAANVSKDPKAKQGGRWAHTHRGDLANKDWEDTAFSLPAGGIADPIVTINKTDHTQNAVVIIKVGQVTPARIEPFSEAQDAIYNSLRDKQYFTLVKEYYDKLRAKAAVEGVDHMVDTATDVAVTRYLVK
jgi:hypothetical protein